MTTTISTTTAPGAFTGEPLTTWTLDNGIVIKEMRQVFASAEAEAEYRKLEVLVAGGWEIIKLGLSIDEVKTRAYIAGLEVRLDQLARV